MTHHPKDYTTIAPFFLIERTPHGHIERVTPLRWVAPHNLPGWSKARQRQVA